MELSFRDIFSVKAAESPQGCRVDIRAAVIALLCAVPLRGDLME